VQVGFLLLTLFIGYQFYEFVRHFEVPGSPFVRRPPSVDAFLPIGGLMAFKYFLFTGIIEPVHPAGFVLFVAILGVSLAVKKGFCGWICPIGTVSQYAWMAGEKIFGRNFRINRFTDIALRALKYILLGLFILLIGVAMAPNMMLLFMITDYYKVVDVRMMVLHRDDHAYDVGPHRLPPVGLPNFGAVPLSRRLLGSFPLIQDQTNEGSASLPRLHKPPR
jgi:polyferredoxin